MGFGRLGGTICRAARLRVGTSHLGTSHRGLRLQPNLVPSDIRNLSLSTRKPSSHSRSAVHRGNNSRIRYASSSAVLGSAASSREATPNSALSINTDPETSAPSEWSLPFEGLDAAKAPEPYIGYLKDLGLDYGTGPTALVQWAFEHLQVDIGLPAWAAVMGVAIVFRIGLLVFAVPASDMGARIKAMNPRIAPVREKMTAALKIGDQATMHSARQEIKAMNKAAGIKTSALFWPLLFQMPLGIGLFRLTKGMSDLPVPGLDGEMVGWISNFAVPDPFYILPLATAGLMYVNMKRSMADNATTGYTEIMAKVIPSITLAVSAFFPALTQVGFFSASVWQAIQSETLRLSWVRQALNLHPTVTETKSTQPNTYEGTMRTEAVEQAAQRAEGQGVLGKITESRDQAVKSLKDSYSKFTGDNAQNKGNKRSPSELKKAQSRETDGKRRDVAEVQERKERDRQLRLRRLQR